MARKRKIDANLVEINKRAGKQLPGKEIESVTMNRSNNAIGIQTNYTDGTGYWDEFRSKDYTSMPAKPVRSEKNSKTKNAAKTATKKSTANKEGLTKRSQKATNTKKTTKKR